MLHSILRQNHYGGILEDTLHKYTTGVDPINQLRALINQQCKACYEQKSLDIELKHIRNSGFTRSGNVCVCVKGNEQDMKVMCVCIAGENENGIKREIELNEDLLLWSRVQRLVYTNILPPHLDTHTHTRAQI